MVLQSQALLRQLLEWQTLQQQVTLQFVEAHRQLMQSLGATGDLPTTALSAIEPPTFPPSNGAPPMNPLPMAIETRPAANRFAPMPVHRPATASTNGAAHAPVVAAAKTTLLAPAERDTIAPHMATPAQFQADLLAAVSERTGYPVEMLELDLPLEAGLGIDSIKTVEIFSHLKQYHERFQQEDQDEEEALKEFTKLKTLGDIVSAYELRYQAAISTGPAPQAIDGSNAVVERFTLEAVAALPSSGQKKSSRASN
jgi:acyl carrier protein